MSKTKHKRWTYAQQFRLMRRRAGRTQAETAAFLGIAPQNISQVETGARKRLGKVYEDKAVAFFDSPIGEAHLLEALAMRTPGDEEIQELISAALSHLYVSNDGDHLPPLGERVYGRLEMPDPRKAAMRLWAALTAMGYNPGTVGEARWSHELRPKKRGCR